MVIIVLRPSPQQAELARPRAATRKSDAGVGGAGAAGRRSEGSGAPEPVVGTSTNRAEGDEFEVRRKDIAFGDRTPVRVQSARPTIAGKTVPVSAPPAKSVVVPDVSKPPAPSIMAPPKPANAVRGLREESVRRALTFLGSPPEARAAALEASSCDDLTAHGKTRSQ